MPHPPELIDMIREQLERDYDPASYQYVIERAIERTPKGARMYPDILILGPDGRRQCAVEIGYTRPEKMTAYRDELHIPDVRWYDKTGVLHTELERKSVAAGVRVRLQLHPPEMVRVYRFGGTCLAQGNGQALFSCEDCIAAAGEVEEPADVLAAAGEDVLTAVITDGTKVFAACYCDKCGATWLDTNDLEAVVDDLRGLTGQEFGRTYGVAERCFWWEVALWLDDAWGLLLDYNDGLFIRPGDAERLQAQLDIISVQTQREAVGQ